ncbi:MAG: class I SAM-dependent methyltransferase [Chloroflexi bacterium]|nr:class I SAM-dependent methyltransferase [Chloroflexota bacterium]
MSDPNPSTDPDALTRNAYANDEHLAVRYRTHELYSRPKVDFPRWVLDNIQWRGDEWVLDVGAGPGSYLAPVQERIPRGRHVAGDLSFGMVQQAQAKADAGEIGLIACDVQQLPFPEGTFDIVLANHMLYHVPDIDRAIAEICRVLRRDGLLLAATNGLQSMKALITLERRACTLLGYPKTDFAAALNVRGFGLENGLYMLSRHFRAVARYDVFSAFHFPEVEPVVAYLNSSRSLREPLLPDDLAWEDFMSMVEKLIARHIRHFGELEVQKVTGVLVATNEGGFAADYLHHLDTIP